MNLKKLEREIRKKTSVSVAVSERYGSILLEGEASDWKQVTEAGYMAARLPHPQVINHISIPNVKNKSFGRPSVESNRLEGSAPDVLIIGGGIIGCAIARELSRYQLDILLIEKEYDVAVHTSSRNDGMIHDGFAPKLGSLKSKYNVLGNKMYDKVGKELDVKVLKNGSLILFDQPFSKPLYFAMKSKAERANVPDTRFMDTKELRSFAPNIHPSMKWAFFLPTAGVTSPYKMTVAYGENAVENGVEIALNTVARSMEQYMGNILRVSTNQGNIFPHLVINAAGICADLVAEMARDEFFTIHPRKGEIALFDKKVSGLFHGILGKPKIFDLNRTSKGGGIIRTADGNLLVGPNNFEVPFREDYSTNRASLKEMLDERLWLIQGLHARDVITYFAGTRAATYKEDFIIQPSQRIKNLIHVAGIQSPGFASAPAIAEDVKEMAIRILGEKIPVKPNPAFNPHRKKTPTPIELTSTERSELIHRNPDYGQIICRCEEISKGEILDALRSPIEVTSIDSIKRRTRAGMGRCQGGFCLPHILEIIHEEKGLHLDQIMKSDQKGQVLIRETKPNPKEEPGDV